MIDRLAVDDDRAARRRRDAEESAGDVGAAGADEAAEADDLAAPDLEADVGKTPGRVRPSTSSATSPMVERGLVQDTP